MNKEIETLLSEQLSSRETAQNNYAALKRVRIKDVKVNGCLYRIQFNPARIVSSAAKVDSKSIQERKCFLCPANLPPMQKGIPFGEHYQILVNPFPIFPKHLTVPELQHVEQRILHRFSDMLDLATYAEDYIIFYNGPQCGASAPDHLHFQAGNKGFLPIEQEWKEKRGEKVITCKDATLWALNDYPRATLVIEAGSKETAIMLFNTVYQAMPSTSGEDEPMMNVLVWKEQKNWIVCIFPRNKHRPSCYTAEGDTNILISPASVDMGGVFITPQEKDFEKITANDIADILGEVCLRPAAFRILIERIKQQL